MKNKGEIILKPTKDNSLRRFHPWVFSGAIAHASEGLQEGDVVKVFANDGAFLGVGHYPVSYTHLDVYKRQYQSLINYGMNKILLSLFCYSRKSK